MMKAELEAHRNLDTVYAKLFGAFCGQDFFPNNSDLKSLLMTKV